MEEAKRATFESLPPQVYQILAGFLEKEDYGHLAIACKQTHNGITKTPQYKGEKAKATFFTKVGEQHQVLLKSKHAGSRYLDALRQGNYQELTTKYKQLAQIHNGGFDVQSDYAVINQIKNDAVHNGLSVIPLMAALKLEIIKTKPAESQYFLNIDCEETKFDINEGYEWIAFLSALGTVALVGGACTAGVAFFASASLELLLPLMVTAALITVVSLSIAGYLGSKHQLGLHQFVLDKNFLNEAKQNVDKKP